MLKKSRPAFLNSWANIAKVVNIITLLFLRNAFDLTKKNWPKLPNKFCSRIYLPLALMKQLQIIMQMMWNCLDFFLKRDFTYSLATLYHSSQLSRSLSRNTLPYIPALLSRKAELSGIHVQRSPPKTNRRQSRSPLNYISDDKNAEVINISLSALYWRYTITQQIYIEFFNR